MECSERKKYPHLNVPHTHYSHCEVNRTVDEGMELTLEDHVYDSLVIRACAKLRSYDNILAPDNSFKNRKNNCKDLNDFMKRMAQDGLRVVSIFLSDEMFYPDPVLINVNEPKNHVGVCSSESIDSQIDVAGKV